MDSDGGICIKLSRVGKASSVTTTWCVLPHMSEVAYTSQDLRRDKS